MRPCRARHAFGETHPFESNAFQAWRVTLPVASTSAPTFGDRSRSGADRCLRATMLRSHWLPRACHRRPRFLESTVTRARDATLRCLPSRRHHASTPYFCCGSSVGVERSCRPSYAGTGLSEFPTHFRSCPHTHFSVAISVVHAAFSGVPFAFILTPPVHLVAHIGTTTRRDLGGTGVLGTICSSLID